MKWSRLIIGIIAVVGFAGCSLVGSESESGDLLSSYEKRAMDSAGDPDEKRVRSILHFYGDTATIEAPESAEAGVPFEVTVTPFGGGCDSPGGARSEVEGLLATIEPYDFTVADDKTVCTAILKFMPRSVQVTFLQPGEAVLRITGLRVDSSNESGVREVIEKKILVR